MKCVKPYLQGDAAYGCGQCLPCRFGRRRVWTHRILLESYNWSENSFVTLTYADDYLPRLADGRATLRKLDAQKWLKRLRHYLHGAQVRYFLVGEYGEDSWRPHYHAILFGFGGCAYEDSRLAPVRNCVCLSCDVLRKSWPYGFVHQGRVERKSAQYVSGYTVKRMVRSDDPRLEGREPEFARMSLRPGIGALSMRSVAEAVKAARVVDCEGDVPSGLRHGVQVMPLGRYLRRRLRAEVGLDVRAPRATLEKAQEVLRDVREAATVVSVTPAGREVKYVDRAKMKALLVSEGKHEEARLRHRQSLFQRGKK